MRSYIIEPAFETFSGESKRTTAAISLIADIVFGCLRQGGDTFQYSVVWANPGDEPGGPCNEDIAVPHVLKLEGAGPLRDWLRRSIDPNAISGGDVRSIATCRTVSFGFDGQAFLLLRHEDAPPVSPDPSLATVEERPHLIRDTDYFDGWIRSELEIAKGS